MNDICFNRDCFRFCDNCMFLPCIYTTKCEGYQISATKQMFKELNNESHKMFG